MTESAASVVEREQPQQGGGKTTAFDNIKALVESRRDTLVKTLTPGIDPEYFIAVSLMAVTRQPKLLLCTPESIVKALRDASELGLMPGLAGMSYLVPYRNNKTRRDEAQLIPGYRGLIELAMRSGKIATIEARVVRERDVFEYEYGTNQYIKHIPYMNLRGEMGEPSIGERGEVIPARLLDAGDYIAAFARVVMMSGQETFDVMSMVEVNRIRQRSAARNNGPWATDTAEMIRKTPLRRLMKYVPMSTSVLRALDLEDYAEAAARARNVTPNATASQLTASLGLSDAAHAAISGETDTDTDTGGDADSDALASSDAASDDNHAMMADADGEMHDPDDDEPSICGQMGEGTGMCVKPKGHAPKPHADGPVDADGTNIWPAS